MSMASKNQALVESVKRLKRAEQELRDARAATATLFEQAARTQPITSLSRLTDINRTTIYWLIRVWSESGTDNDNRDNRA